MDMAAWKRVCVLQVRIRFNRGLCLVCRHYIGDEDCENNLPRGMASTNIQPMDISGSKSELSEQWRVWLRGFTYFAEGKANLQNAARKRDELLYRAGSGMQVIFENLTIITAPEGQADDVYSCFVKGCRKKCT